MEHTAVDRDRIRSAVVELLEAIGDDEFDRLIVLTFGCDAAKPAKLELRQP